MDETLFLLWEYVLSDSLLLSIKGTTFPLNRDNLDNLAPYKVMVFSWKHLQDTIVVFHIL